jgi:hypothetical protein
MQKIDDCKEIWLAVTRAGIATRPEKCVQTFRLVVTAQYIYHNYSQQTARTWKTARLEGQKEDNM